MSIRGGILYINGEKKENTGSESICSYCHKAYGCKAFRDDYKLTVNYFGAPAEVLFKNLLMISQILQCPINEFDYKPYKKL